MRWDESGREPGGAMASVTKSCNRKPRGAALKERSADASPAIRGGRTRTAAGRGGSLQPPAVPAPSPSAPEKRRKEGAERRRGLADEPKGSAPTEKTAENVAVLPPPGTRPDGTPTRSETQNRGAQGRTTMRKVALDLGTKKTTYCEVAGGQVVQRATVSGVSSLESLLGPDQPPATVAIEACREAWYVHDQLIKWGNQPVLVDTTRSRQIGVGAHGRKTDRLDAETLARALERGGIPAAHVLSPSRRELRNVLGVRRCLVEMRTTVVTTIRGLAREKGCAVPSCRTKGFVGKARVTFARHSELQGLTDPLLTTLESIDTQLAEVEEQLARCCAQEPVIAQLTTVPGVGSIVAAAFVSVVDDAGRFHSAHHLESYLGLVPSEDSSGGKRRLGAITKEGNCYVRALLVQSAWSILREAPKDDPLRLWATQLAARRSKRIAVVALARRLVGVLWALWRDGTVYDRPHLAQQGIRGHRGAVQSNERKIEALQAARKKHSVLIPRAEKLTKARSKPRTRINQLARAS